MKQICTSIQSEGGYDPTGCLWGITVNNDNEINLNTTFKPIVSFKPLINLPSGQKYRGYSYLVNLDLLVTGSNSVQYKILQDPTLTGATVWNEIHPFSFFRQNENATGFSGGIIRYSGTAGAGGNKSADAATHDQFKDLYMYSSPSGQERIYTIIARAVTQTSSIILTGNRREVSC
jgi:hypothetical protein